MEEQSLIEIINSEMGIDLPPAISFEAMRLQLQALVNDMIKTDFQKLVNVLYRVDVNERKLKARREFTRQDDDISDEEKW
jgi:hypothetical protein